MRDIVNATAWQDLGGGKIAPAGSIGDHALASLLSNYKRHVAGSHRSVVPDEIETAIPPGNHIVSEKIDGETWFLHVDRVNAVLLSPTGKALEGVPVIREAENILSGWSGVLAGELYVTVSTDRPRVFDLHAALGREPQLKRLRFAIFDILRDGEADAQQLPFTERVERLQALLADGEKIHPACFDTVDGPDGVRAAYKQIVGQHGAEGIVVHTADRRVLKIKPEITIDAAVVGYAESPSNKGFTELVLALQRADSTWQHIGRVRTGWTREQQRGLHERLRFLTTDSSYRMVSDHGVLTRWVKPDLVVEVKCNDLLAANSRDEPIRRMQIEYSETEGWRPIQPVPAASMINAVFRGVREDKRAALPDVRWSQVSDLVPIRSLSTPDPGSFPASEIIRREVYAKRLKAGTAVRKLVVWKTNKHDQDPLYASYVTHFTDYSPGRKEPLKTDVRVAGSAERIHEFADDWLARTIKRGWEQVASTPAAAMQMEEVSVPSAEVTAPQSHAYLLTIGFARSISPSFPIVRRRLNALAYLGTLEVIQDDKGREAWFELTLQHGLVENARRIANLLKIVRPWKTTEISHNGELLGKHEVDDLINRLETVRRCWMKKKGQGASSCHRSCDLGCDALRIRSSHEFLDYSGCGAPPWWTVGAFDGECLAIDKTALREQIMLPRNAEVHLCLHFDQDILLSKIDGLSGAIPADGEEWIHLYQRDGVEPIWIWPKNRDIPPRLRTEPDGKDANGGLGINIHAGDLVGEEGDVESADVTATPSPIIPPTRYADVQGQDAAVEAVRDMIELPLKHAHLFEQLGAKPQATGIILAGPPGTGKTLLARAVAGECGAHVEVVNGPELLSKWIGATEEALRMVFSRAKEFSPSIILFDELDSIAGARDSSEGGSQSHNSVVAQLLTLMDGLEDRGQIFLIATTNRVESIDPALRRPGRFDQVVWMGPPDEGGRKAIFQKYLEGLRVEQGLKPTDLATRLARLTPGFTGADIAFTTHRAVLFCVKEASRDVSRRESLALSEKHFRHVIQADRNTGHDLISACTTALDPLATRP